MKPIEIMRNAIDMSKNYDDDGRNQVMASTAIAILKMEKIKYHDIIVVDDMIKAEYSKIGVCDG